MTDTPTTPEPRPSDILKAVRAQIPVLASPRRPLAIGIGPALISRIAELTGVEPRLAGFAVSFHCRTAGYLRGTREGAPRVDLDGNPVGTVTAEEAAYAAQRLAEVERKAKARDAAAKAAAPAPRPQPTRQPRVNPASGRRILSVRVSA